MANMEATFAQDASVIAEADRLYDKLEFDDLYAHLKPFSESANAEVVWRLTRATADKAKSSTDAEVKKTLMFEAMGYAERALELDGNNSACHKWYAVLLQYVGKYEGTKHSLRNLYTIRDHFKKAIELNPADATSIHLLGKWCYEVADLAWAERQIAAIVFDAPPSSSFEEALEYFEQAEKVDPDYSMNHLMMGKSYLKLKNNSLAKQYLEKAEKAKGADGVTIARDAWLLLKGIPE